MNLNDMQKLAAGETITIPRTGGCVKCGASVEDRCVVTADGFVCVKCHEAADLNARVEALVQKHHEVCRTQCRYGWLDQQAKIASGYVGMYPDPKTRCENSRIRFHPGHGFPPEVRWSVERQAWYDSSEKDSCGGKEKPETTAKSGQPVNQPQDKSSCSVAQRCAEVQAGGSNMKQSTSEQDKSSAPAIPAGLPPIPEGWEYYEGPYLPSLYVCVPANVSGAESFKSWHTIDTPDWDGRPFPWTSQKIPGWVVYAIRPKSGAGAAKAAADMRKHQSESEPSVSQPAPEPITSPAEAELAEKFMDQVQANCILELAKTPVQTSWTKMIDGRRFLTLRMLVGMPTNTDDAQTETDRLVNLARKIREFIEGKGNGAQS